ncbi:hypothetical protein FRC09_018016 [Ceratobasidium sp. 395]|nr:hypothetical protein FRC09_018016 [Ceratobasidium sp. 395]
MPSYADRCAKIVEEHPLLNPQRIDVSVADLEAKYPDIVTWSLDERSPDTEKAPFDAVFDIAYQGAVRREPWGEPWGPDPEEAQRHEDENFPADWGNGISNTGWGEPEPASSATLKDWDSTPGRRPEYPNNWSAVEREERRILEHEDPIPVSEVSLIEAFSYSFRLLYFRWNCWLDEAFCLN